MTGLFSPLELRDTTIPNRVMVSPMYQYSCESRDGVATGWHHVHLGSRAVGGVGLVMPEATAVEACGRITPHDLGIWDDYGGDFEGRTRLTREVTAAVRDVWPDDKPVFVRVSGTDWYDDRDSWTAEQSARLASRLHEVGADLVDVSSGAIAPDSYPPQAGPNYQLPPAETVREQTESDVAIGTVGGIITPEQAQAAVANDRADLAIVGREFRRDPYFGLRAADALDATGEVSGPPQYRRAFGF